MPTQIKTLIAVLTSLMLVKCGHRSIAASEVVLALPSMTLLSTTAFVAEDMKLFEDEGLVVVVRHIIGVGSPNAVLAGSADFTMGTGSTFLRAASEGQRFLAIANVVDRPMVELVLRKDLAQRLDVTERMSFADRGQTLRGLTIAVQGIGSMVHTWARYVAAAGGLDVERDIRIAPMDPSAMLPALRSRRIDGFATSPPFTTQAVLDGDAVMLASGLTDAPHLLPFAYGLVYAKPETCVVRREVCARMARAFAAASRLVHEQPTVVFESVIRRRFASMELELLKAAWQRARLAHATDTRVTVDQLEHSQQVSLSAGLLDPMQAIASYDDLYAIELGQ